MLTGYWALDIPICVGLLAVAIAGVALSSFFVFAWWMDRR